MMSVCRAPSLYIFSALLLTVTSLRAQTFSVYGGDMPPLLALKDTRNNLSVFLVYGTQNLSVQFSGAEPALHQWFRFPQGSAADAVPVHSTQSGITSTLPNPLPGFGYCVGLPTLPSAHFVYIIDYEPLLPSVTDFTFDPTSDPCDRLTFSAQASIPKIFYYIPSSHIPYELKRAFTLSYETLQWSQEDKAFLPTDVHETIADPSSFSIPSPLCDTRFRLTGDSFSLHFGQPIDLLSPSFIASSVQAHADTLLLSPSLSAPASIRFSAYANDPVAFLYSWTIYPNNEPDKPIIRFTGKELEYTFTRSGLYTATLQVANRDGSCADETQLFSFEIPESFIDIPNAFSPTASPGVNDVFRIAHKSLLNFRASVFNRWGKLLFSWSNPDDGWDGRIHGALAPPGTYFYVIQYTDAQGRPRKHTGPVHLF
ncbi:MAG: gliding motility-associated C-terminal domain-containing protein [Tannerellaceae bacterium]|jgi:gliding motility-associated-like protein|nr:gliding motility-associated C-terminal domain-containing protein [Tannerellaceae bacterium]